jgi:hypothetical protein
MRKFHTWIGVPILALALAGPLHAQIGQTKAETAPPPTPSPGMPGTATYTKPGMDEDSGAVKRPSSNTPGLSNAQSKPSATVKGSAEAPGVDAGAGAMGNRP